MRIKWTFDDGIWNLAFLLDPEDDVKGICSDLAPLELRTNTCQVRLPGGTKSGPDVHPDLLAVAAWTVAAPWTRQKVTFDRPISPALAEVFRTDWGVDAGPVGGDPRSGTRLAISYSGGADSVAAADMIPEAPFIHFQRIRHPRVPNRWEFYRSDVLATLAGETGRDLTIVQSDLELLLNRPGPGYPEHHAVLVGALLLADDMDLGGIATGYEIGSRWLGGDRYIHRYTPDNPMWSADGKWGRLFQAVGLPLVLPVGGISEAVTMRLALESDLRDQVRWCLRGPRSGPCGVCSKCVYKELIQAAIERRPLDTKATTEMPVSRQWQGPPPYSGQEMIEYGCAHVPGIENTLFAKAADYLQATEESTAWVERCYPPAIDEIPEPWRKQVDAYIADKVGLMTADQMRRVETWGAR
ncbi:hypothetical protein GCM10023194_01700 [Planotetraspora phitsanulokensis]|uniref:7-cyano-7-deazaguanine synthase (Queuosine biosynthesis) n=1 Tax=Planotetraspora phitsanulokensis TaxID=575192 RepID=A0A8J3XL22_9ACTN|nr:DUF6395 domain-containing protein [Planotetraspora phitsanulokensis]GII40203.1 hypothetical protein Pph01_52060 [Planotetraspora phitsanulokensis]